MQTQAATTKCVIPFCKRVATTHGYCNPCKQRINSLSKKLSISQQLIVRPPSPKRPKLLTKPFSDYSDKNYAINAFEKNATTLLPDSSDLSEIRTYYEEHIEKSIPEERSRLCQKIGENAVHLLNSLPKHSHLRVPLLHALCKNVPTPDIRGVLEIKTSTTHIQRSKQDSEALMKPLMVVYPPNITRTVITPESIQLIREFWLEWTRPSVTRVINNKANTQESLPVHYQTHPTVELWSEYRKRVPDGVCQAVFKNHKPKQVKKLFWRTGLCPHCRSGKQAQERLKKMHVRFHKGCLACTKDKSCVRFQGLTDKSAFEEEEARISKYQRHLEIAKHQAEQYQVDIAALADDTCIVVMDFAAKFQIPITTLEFQDEFFQKININDLVLVLLWKENGSLRRKHYDFFGTEQLDNNSQFVKKTWNEFLMKEEVRRFQHIKLWSDGGPKHFKTRETLGWFSSITPDLIRITYNFFASYHGKGPCDAHTGVGKTKVRREVQKGEDVQDVYDLIGHYLKLKNTEAILLNTVTLTSDDPIPNIDTKDISKFKHGIKKWHQFEFPQHGKIRQRSLSNTGEWEEQVVLSEQNEFKSQPESVISIYLTQNENELNPYAKSYKPRKRPL